MPASTLHVLLVHVFLEIHVYSHEKSQNHGLCAGNWSSAYLLKMISPYENMDITPTIPFPYNPEHP